MTFLGNCVRKKRVELVLKKDKNYSASKKKSVHLSHPLNSERPRTTFMYNHRGASKGSKILPLFRILILSYSRVLLVQHLHNSHSSFSTKLIPDTSGFTLPSP